MDTIYGLTNLMDAALASSGEVMGVPVLILSALAHVDERVRGLKAGGDDYLTKPFDAEMLVFRVEELLGRSRRVLAS